MYSKKINFKKDKKFFNLGTAKLYVKTLIPTEILAKVKTQNIIYHNRFKDLLATLSRTILYKTKLDTSKSNLTSLGLIIKMFTRSQFFLIENVRLD